MVCWLVISYDIRDQHRLFHTGRKLACHFWAVCLEYQRISPLNADNLILIFGFVLPTYSLLQICQDFCLCDANSTPLFIRHVFGLLLCAQPFHILAAFAVFFLKAWMGFDCIQILSHLVHEITSSILFPCQFQQNAILPGTELSLCVGNDDFSYFGNHRIWEIRNLKCHCSAVSLWAPIFTLRFLLPELCFCWERINTKRCKYGQR